jgi:lysophospholipase L1-like esterase
MRFVPLVLGVLLLTSLAANALLLREVWLQRIDLRNLRLDPNGLSAYPEATRPALAAGERLVVAIGDSRVYEWADPGLPGARWVNRGINGQTTAQVRARAARHALAMQPDIVVIQAGVNDLRLIAQLRDPAEAAEVERACIDNLRALVAEIRASGANVIVLTVVPIAADARPGAVDWSTEVDAAIARVNTELRTLADDGVLVLDAAALLPADASGRAQPAYMRDALHFNAQGYTVLNTALARAGGF